MRRDQVLLALVLGLILLVFLFVYFLPQTGTIGQMKRELVQVREQAADSQQFHDRLAQLQEEHDRYAAILTEVDRQLPVGRGSDGAFLAAVTTLLAQEKLQAGALEPQAPIPGQQLVETPLRLSCSGPFPALFRFLRHLEALPRVSRIDQVSIGGPRNLAGGPVTLELHLSIFSLKPPEEAAAGPGEEKKS